MSKSCTPNQSEEQCCDHCPKGQYVLGHCTRSTPTKCETCVHETYTADSNYLTKCLACTQCHLENQHEVKSCQPHSDRKCECNDGYYCKSYSDGHCDHCHQVTVCPPGKGVSAKPTSSRDTVCKPCATGTFSSVADYSTSCHNHTNCEALGRHLKTPGSDTTDAVCGDFVHSESNCPWVISTALCVGLIVTILISLIIILLYWRAKRKSQQTVCSQNYGPPVLPPDIIKHPNSPELKTLFDKDEILFNTDDCCLECDGVDGITMTTMTASEKYGHTVSCDQYGGFTTCEPSMFQSEPQEDEWPGV
ncbi:tumor necrosis factor receptor superfamily member 1B [Salminus brasiliensis]|uniref:tumor necrosis factor receptor superfamily member 1B n=1 Tax=Salminus brasiliensis TaxID=930266 RepID=UPI003B82FE39